MTSSSLEMTCGRLVVMGAVVLLSAAPLQAQNRFAIEPYIGAYLTDDDGAFSGTRLDLEPRPGPPIPPPEVGLTTGILLGARASWQIRPNWTVEGVYGRSSYATEVTVDVSTVLDPIPREETFELTEHDAHLYYGAIRYDVTGGSVQPFFVAGAGAVTVSTDLGELGPFLGDVDSVTDPLLSLGSGLVIDVAPRTRIRGDLRDQVQFCSDGSGLCEEDEALHNVEISAGIEIAF
jgi:hypothetical protein